MTARPSRAAGADPSLTVVKEPIVRLVAEPIDTDALARELADPGVGAIASFIGTVRDNNHGRRVLFLEYEAYPPMAERAMRAIGVELPERHGPCRVAMVHRVGRLEIGEASVAIVVASAHRGTALRACADAIERLKTTVPIWKKEHFEGGEVWIEGEQACSGPDAERERPDAAEGTDAR